MGTIKLLNGNFKGKLPFKNLETTILISNKYLRSYSVKTSTIILGYSLENTKGKKPLHYSFAIHNINKSQDSGE